MSVLHLVWRHRALVAVLVRRELDARYRASVLGFFWSLLNPLLLLIVYAVVFTYIFSPRFPGGQPYPLFLFSGLLPWLFFSGAVLDGSLTLIDNGPLLAKVMCPPEIFPAVTVVVPSRPPPPRAADPLRRDGGECGPRIPPISVDVLPRAAGPDSRGS